MSDGSLSVKPAFAAALPTSVPGTKWLHMSHPEILQFSRVVSYEKKDLIIREGIFSDSVCVLLGGTAMAYRTAETGQQVLICLVQPGKLYGFMSMFGNGVQTMTVEALEPCKNLEIDKTRLKRLLMANPPLLWKFTEEISEGIATYAQVVETSCLTVEQRIYKSLLTLAEECGYKVASGIELRVDLTQEKLATCASTTRVTTARILSGLIEQGILRVKPKPWVICRIDRLVNLLRTGGAGKPQRLPVGTPS